MQRSEHPQLHRVQKNATDAHAFLPQKILPRTIAHRKMLLYVMIREIPSTNHEICLHATILRRVCTLPFAVVPRMHQQYPTSLTAFACKNQRQRTNVHRVMARRVLTSKLAIATSFFAGPQLDEYWSVAVDFCTQMQLMMSIIAAAIEEQRGNEAYKRGAI